MHAVTSLYNLKKIKSRTCRIINGKLKSITKLVHSVWKIYFHQKYFCEFFNYSFFSRKSTSILTWFFLTKIKYFVVNNYKSRDNFVSYLRMSSTLRFWMFPYLRKWSDSIDLHFIFSKIYAIWLVHVNKLSEFLFICRQRKTLTVSNNALSQVSTDFLRQ